MAVDRHYTEQGRSGQLLAELPQAKRIPWATALANPGGSVNMQHFQQ